MRMRRSCRTRLQLPLRIALFDEILHAGIVADVSVRDRYSIRNLMCSHDNDTSIFRKNLGHI